MSEPRKLDDELDRLLADDGGELGALYRRLPRVEPPRRLDRSVLGEAARAVRGTQPRRQRWLVGFGSAAGLVLAAGIAWHVGHEALRQQEHDAMRGAPTYVPVQPIEPPSRRRDAAQAVDAERAPAPSASAGPSREAKGQAAKPAGEITSPAPRGSLRQTIPLPPPTAAPEAVPMPQSAPAPSAMERSEAPATEAAPAAAFHEEGENLSKQAADAEKPAKRERAAGAPPSSSAELRRDMQLAPQDWLAHIQQLLRQGRRQQAIESLQLFRRAHPDWQLPEELRALDP